MKQLLTLDEQLARSKRVYHKYCYIYPESNSNLLKRLYRIPINVVLDYCSNAMQKIQNEIDDMTDDYTEIAKKRLHDVKKVFEDKKLFTNALFSFTPKEMNSTLKISNLYPYINYPINHSTQNVLDTITIGSTFIRINDLYQTSNGNFYDISSERLTPKYQEFYRKKLNIKNNDVLMMGSWKPNEDWFNIIDKHWTPHIKYTYFIQFIYYLIAIESVEKLKDDMRSETNNKKNVHSSIKDLFYFACLPLREIRFVLEFENLPTEDFNNALNKYTKILHSHIGENAKLEDKFIYELGDYLRDKDEKIITGAIIELIILPLYQHYMKELTTNLCHKEETIYE